MNFEKYPSIDNYHNVDITKDFYQVGKYVATEKIDGCNISLYITKNTFKYAKRNGFAEEGFYNIGHYLSRLDRLLEYVQKEIYEDDEIILYGEFYGRQIMTRIDYPTVDFKFYAMKKNGAWCTFRDFQNFLEPVKDYIVPILGVFENIKESLELPNVFQSLLISEVSNKSKAEGYVVCPYDDVPFKDNLSLCVKNKNVKFFERSSKKKIPVIEDTQKILNMTEDEKIAYDLNKKFLEYINENRALSLVSKMGLIDNPKKYPIYVRELISDATTDFMKDFPYVDDLTPSQKKMVFKVGSLAFELVKSKCCYR